MCDGIRECTRKIGSPIDHRQIGHTARLSRWVFTGKAPILSISRPLRGLAIESGSIIIRALGAMEYKERVLEIWRSLSAGSKKIECVEFLDGIWSDPLFLERGYQVHNRGDK